MANIAVIYGSVRSSRQGIKAAKFIVKHLEKRGHDVTLVDPMEHKLPMLDKRHKDYDEAPEVIEKVHKILDESDGFVIVSAEYNHSVPPALKNILDHFQKEYNFKPSGIVSYSAGSFGGIRAAEHLRAITGTLGMPSIPTVFPISKIGSSIDENGKAVDEDYDKRVVKFLDEFEWYVEAFKEQRKKGTPY